MNKNQAFTDDLPPELRLYTRDQAATILNVSLRKLQDWVRDGSLPHIRLGNGDRLVRIRASDLYSFIERASSHPVNDAK